MALALIVFGQVIMLFGGILLAIAAFKQRILWGFAVIFLPFANIIFLFKYWHESKNAFYISILGLLCYLGGLSMSGTKINRSHMYPQIPIQQTSPSTPTATQPAPPPPPRPTPSFFSKPQPKPKAQTTTKPFSKRESKADNKSASAKKPGSGKSPQKEAAPIVAMEDYVGKTLNEVQESMGKPKGVMKAGGKTIVIYPDIELTSDDGLTVSSQKVTSR